MNPTSMVLRWYRESTSQAQTRQRFTTEEVLRLLRPDDAGGPADAATAPASDPCRAARSATIREAAARPSAWLGELSPQQRQEIGSLADRLPTVLFHHTRGGEPSELLRRFGGWSTWRYQRALEVAGACIASHLNSVSAT